MPLAPLLWVLLAAVATLGLSKGPAHSVSMKVVNNAGKPIVFFWKDMNNPGNLVAQTKKALRNSSVSLINSYDGHTFVAKFRDDTGAEAEWMKGPDEETVTISFDEAEHAFSVKSSTQATEVQDKVESYVQMCQAQGSDLTQCLSDAVAGEVARMRAVQKSLTDYRDVMASKLRNYTCADHALQTTEPIKTHTYRQGARAYALSDFLDHDDAKLFTLDNFVSDEECAHLMDYARPLLSKATVAGDDGLDSFSATRQAWQAGYEFHPDTAHSDPVWPLYQRIISVVNDRAQLDIHPEGQEGFTIIKYGPGDQYLNHCDGQCDGGFFKTGGRVATAVLYCQAAERGGKTTFSRADVVVNPQKGMGAFFSYKAPDGRMDEGLTEHSGCPVMEGEKWIAVAWLREGVTNERPWTVFDPEGIEVLERDEDAPDAVAGVVGEAAACEADESEPAEQRDEL